MLRRSIVADALCRFGIYGAGPLLFPIKASPCIRHRIVDVPGVGNLFGDIRRMGCNPGGNDALFYILHIRKRKMLGGVT